MWEGLTRRHGDSPHLHGSQSPSLFIDYGTFAIAELLPDTMSKILEVDVALFDTLTFVFTQVTLRVTVTLPPFAMVLKLQVVVAPLLHVSRVVMTET